MRAVRLGEIVPCPSPKKIYIGKNSYVNGGELSTSPHAKIVICNDSLISYRVHLRIDTHNYYEDTASGGQGDTNLIP